MDTTKLRQKILDLAIHGKLVPQDPNDEPASVLLERIRAEKERLVKEGKIKKSKASKTSDTPHYEQMPFEVPSSWEWVNFGFVCKKLTDGSHNPPPKKSTGYTVISAQNIKNGEIIFTEKDRYTDDIGFNKENSRTKISKGDIILGIIGGSIGNVGIFNHDKPVIAQRSVSIIDSYVSNLYCFYLLQSPIFQSLFVEKSIGNAQAGVYLGELEKLMIPLPPIAEQIRIVAEIEKWCALINDIEQGKTNLQTTIKQTKSKILDLAIHGKLVPQDPSDEPASELLKRINPNAENTCDNGQYGKLPEEWTMCRLRDIFKITMGQSPNGETINNDSGIEFHQGKLCFSEIYLQHSNQFTTEPTKIAEDNSLLLCVRAPVGTINITQRRICIGRGLCSLKPLVGNLKFYFYLMQTLKTNLEEKATGTTFKAISTEIIKNEIMPLPPLVEQHRIVSKIEELFNQLDQIQKSLEA